MFSWDIKFLPFLFICKLDSSNWKSKMKTSLKNMKHLASIERMINQFKKKSNFINQILFIHQLSKQVLSTAFNWSNQFDQRSQTDPNSGLELPTLPSSIEQSRRAKFSFSTTPRRSHSWASSGWYTCMSRSEHSSHSRCPRRCTCLRSRTKWRLRPGWAREVSTCLVLPCQ